MARGAEVGVDVECVAAFQFTAGLAADYCSRREQDRLATLPETARAAEFLRLWTAKEAVLKLRGTGLGQDAQPASLLEQLRPQERVVELPAGPDLIASLAVGPLTPA